MDIERLEKSPVTQALSVLRGAIPHSRSTAALREAAVPRYRLRYFPESRNSKKLALMLTLCGEELVGSQCSGALLFAKLGLLEGRPACKTWRPNNG
jgi:transcriptional regulator GlxA family with amidase domain